jgi:CDP-diacylglycerol--inositol 3-phosphatidyltransferase
MSELKNTHDTKHNNLDFSKAPNVFLFAANIMDYLRVAFVMYAFYYSRTHPILFLSFYFVAFVLDMFDGMAARALNQKSKYGATLDMVIDRISTSGLLMVLSNFYPEYFHVFVFLMMLDIGSHWLQTHSGFMDPNIKNDNHKNLEEAFWILNFYYKNRLGLGVTCLGAEVFLLLLYYLHFDMSLMKVEWFVCALYINGAIYVLKQFISVIQTISASQRIVRFDQKEYLESKNM